MLPRVAYACAGQLASDADCQRTPRRPLWLTSKVQCFPHSRREPRPQNQRDWQYPSSGSQSESLTSYLQGVSMYFNYSHFAYNHGHDGES